jgi:hypothetical protein
MALAAKAAREKSCKRTPQPIGLLEKILKLVKWLFDIK